MDDLAFAELDPEPFRNEAAKLSEGLCRRDAGACPRTRDLPGHSHISEIAHWADDLCCGACFMSAHDMPDAAQLAQTSPVTAEDRAQEFGQSEHVLPMRQEGRQGPSPVSGACTFCSTARRGLFDAWPEALAASFAAACRPR